MLFYKMLSAKPFPCSEFSLWTEVSLVCLKCQEGCVKGTVLAMPHVMTMNKTDACGPPQPIVCKAKLQAFAFHSPHVHPWVNNFVFLNLHFSRCKIRR